MNTYTPNSKAAALVANLKEARENISAIRELWIALFGEPTPSNEQIHRWLIMYEFDIVAAAIQDLATWHAKNHQKLKIIEEKRQPTSGEVKKHTKTLLDLIRYVSGIMRNKRNGTDK